jgi:hypothetical protein
MSLKPLNSLALIITALIGLNETASAQIKHRLLLADEGAMQVLLIDQFNPANNWTVQTPDNNRDMQLVGNNRVMVSDPTGGFCELDITTGAKKRNVTGFGAVQSVIRLANGNTLLCGDNLSGGTGVTIVEIDSLSNIKRKISYPGYSTVRLMRKTPQNTFFFGANDSLLVEGDSTGKIIAKIVVKGAVDVYMAVRLRNGNILVSTGYGATILEIKQTGEVVKTYGGANQAQATLIHPYFYNSFQVLNNGHIVTTNWQGHGAGHGGVGIQVLEYDTTGAMVWYWKDSTKYSSLHSVIVLDSLNTQLLYDDFDGGVMKPIMVVSVRDDGMYSHLSSTQSPLTGSGFSRLGYFDLLGKNIVLPDAKQGINSDKPCGFYIIQKGHSTQSYLKTQKGKN